MTTAPASARSRLGVLIGVLTSLTAGVILFAGPDAGLADNGDGGRYTCQLGLAPTRYIQHNSAWFTFEPAQHAQSCRSDPATRSPSSWVWMVLPLIRLAQMVAGPGFDLRWIGASTCVLLGLLGGALAMSWRSGGRAALLLSLPVLLVALDVTFLGYASAPYVEIGAVLLVLLFLALLIRAAGRDGRPADILLLAVVGCALAAVKAQTATAAVPVAVVILLLARRTRRGRDRRGRHRVALASTLAVGLLSATAVAEVRAQGTNYWPANQYNLLFATALVNSPDPEADLAELGLDPALAEFAGTQIWDPVNALQARGYPQAAAEFGRADFLIFVLQRPEQVRALADRAALEISRPRVRRQSDTLVPDAMRPVTVHPDGLAARALGLLRPIGASGLLAIWALGIGVGLAGWLPRSAGPLARQYGAALIFCATFAPVMAVTAVLGDGYGEIRKHLVFAAYSTALELALLVGMTSIAVAEVCRRRYPVRERARSTA